MRFIDTHCHLDDIIQRLQLPDYTELKRRYFPPEFGGCVTISCDPNSIEATLQFLEEEDVYGAFGIHPHESGEYSTAVIERIAVALRHPKCVAYGEIGLDYHYDHASPETQRKVFVRQIEVGISLGKPLILHTREAEADTLEIMADRIPRDWPMHLHCFTSSTQMAETLLSEFSNLYIGFTGIVTFKNADAVRQTVRLVPLQRMLVETDGPYLAPDPFRGQVAHPGHIPRILAKLAELKEKPMGDVAEILLDNARKLYGIRENAKQ